MAVQVQLTGATFSPDHRHRYSLERVWNPHLPHVAVIGFNPSTADTLANDPTMIRTINFAHGFGFGGLTMLNLYTLRTSDPKEIWDHGHPIGPLADHILGSELLRADLVICAWGALAKPRYQPRAREVYEKIQRAGNVQAFSIGPATKNGHPPHPLYLKSNSELTPWPPITGGN